VLGQTIGNNQYIAGLRDWVTNGAESKYVMSQQKLKPLLRTAPRKIRQADAHFNLATHLHALGHADPAAEHWKTSKKLHPDCWNYHPQLWSFEPKTAGPKWFKKFMALKGKPYYEPLDLPQDE
jgi:hypothetical protein